MQLIIETGADQHCKNLSIANKIAILILDKYRELGFQNIVLAKKMLNYNLIKLLCIIHNHPAYMPLHYILLFFYGKLG